MNPLRSSSPPLQKSMQNTGKMFCVLGALVMAAGIACFCLCCPPLGISLVVLGVLCLSASVVFSRMASANQRRWLTASENTSLVKHTGHQHHLCPQCQESNALYTQGRSTGLFL